MRISRTIVTDMVCRNLHLPHQDRPTRRSRVVSSGVHAPRLGLRKTGAWPTSAICRVRSSCALTSATSFTLPAAHDAPRPSRERTFVVATTVWTERLRTTPAPGLPGQSHKRPTPVDPGYVARWFLFQACRRRLIRVIPVADPALVRRLSRPCRGEEVAGCRQDREQFPPEIRGFRGMRHASSTPS
jgi:hypothetical protein